MSGGSPAAPLVPHFHTGVDYSKYVYCARAIILVIINYTTTDIGKKIPPLVANRNITRGGNFLKGCKLQKSQNLISQKKFKNPIFERFRTCFSKFFILSFLISRQSAVLTYKISTAGENVAVLGAKI